MRKIHLLAPGIALDQLDLPRGQYVEEIRRVALEEKICTLFNGAHDAVLKDEEQVVVRGLLEHRHPAQVCWREIHQPILPRHCQPLTDCHSAVYK